MLALRLFQLDPKLCLEYPPFRFFPNDAADR